MTWSPPHIEHYRCVDVRFRGCLPMFLLVTLCGCTAVPRMAADPAISSPSAARVSSATPSTYGAPAAVTPPEFDIGAPSSLAATPSAISRLDADTPSSTRSTVAQSPVPSAASAPSASSPPARSGSIAAPVPTDSRSHSESSATQKQAVNRTSEKSPVPSAGSSKVTTKPDSATPGSPAPLSNSPSPRISASEPKGVVVTPPKPFAWTSAGKSTGGRAFQIASPGSEGYRSLVVGSVGGNDPSALLLVDLLAKRLHDDSVILGGFDCTLIRTLNPDGAAKKVYLNEKGQYINELFPESSGETSNAPAEVVFLLNQLKELQPQRVVHVRTIRNKKGVIAASETCQLAGKEAASWLDFQLVRLPDSRNSRRSLESYISLSGNSEIITFAFPESSSKDELWELYGDTLLNLLLGEDAASRELARKQSMKSSADRRNQNLGK